VRSANPVFRLLRLSLRHLIYGTGETHVRDPQPVRTVPTQRR